MKCPECKSTNVYRYGTVTLRSGVQQKWHCHSCGRNFKTKLKGVK